MSAREVVVDSMSRWAISEAREIEQGFRLTPGKVTAADVYASLRTGVPAATLAADYAERMDAAMVALLEERWERVEKRCVEYGVTL